MNYRKHYKNYNVLPYDVNIDVAVELNPDDETYSVAHHAELIAQQKEKR